MKKICLIIICFIIVFICTACNNEPKTDELLVFLKKKTGQEFIVNSIENTGYTPTGAWWTVNEWAFNISPKDNKSMTFIVTQGMVSSNFDEETLFEIIEQSWKAELKCLLNDQLKQYFDTYHFTIKPFAFKHFASDLKKYHNINIKKGIDIYHLPKFSEYLNKHESCKKNSLSTLDITIYGEKKIDLDHMVDEEDDIIQLYNDIDKTLNIYNHNNTTLNFCIEYEDKISKIKSTSDIYTDEIMQLREGKYEKIFYKEIIYPKIVQYWEDDIKKSVTKFIENNLEECTENILVTNGCNFTNSYYEERALLEDKFHIYLDYDFKREDIPDFMSALDNGDDVFKVITITIKKYKNIKNYSDKELLKEKEEIMNLYKKLKYDLFNGKSIYLFINYYKDRDEDDSYIERISISDEDEKVTIFR
ncbi:hypothetical protein [Inediibacterium massiliense]|uniref:hypothetical protein n=1 Tax=Inediibacterium massiliense TaxID=1658111 RepID=UPI0006B479EE|nr:hypothetical protein [Inediibacterium massiliense]